MYKVLVIEDEDCVRSNVRDILELSDFEPIAARNGVEGVEMAFRHQPDLIICDVMMPELDGHGVLKRLREEEKTATTPFIFLTARADRTDLRQGMQLGADDYLTKPFTPEELIESVTVRLDKQASVRAQSQEQMDALRNNLLKALPHEFNTPLNGIIGFASLLKIESDVIEPDEIREIAEALEHSGRRLHRLVQNYLFYAQLEMIAGDRDKLKPLKEQDASCSLQSIVPEVAREIASEAEREADLCLELPEAMVPMGKSYFRKLVQESIDNAFKFSQPGTPVEIAAIARGGNLVELSIRDRGRGMSPEQIAQIGAYMQFERQLYAQEGSGLGLAIAKRLVEFHGGSLKLECQDGQTLVLVCFGDDVQQN
ncbi:MAG: response regulator [Cyanobacteria bacterium SBLK]|nr:response regulator [Cyanobacteria bacterium SBLK]